MTGRMYKLARNPNYWFVLGIVMLVVAVSELGLAIFGFVRNDSPQDWISVALFVVFVPNGVLQVRRGRAMRRAAEAESAVAE
jgi:uncharacterized membrane protein YhaH (DUF805 family)